MSDKLLNLKQVSKYLGISERDLRTLVDRGEIPAYRLGGTVLRFRKDQIDKIKLRAMPKVVNLEKEDAASGEAGRWERLLDFFYFHDFYIISIIIITFLLMVIFLL